MLKHIIALLSCTFALTLNASKLHASFIETYTQSNVFKDTESLLYWYDTPKHFAGKTRGEILSLLTTFTVHSEDTLWNNWRLATQQEIQQLSFNIQTFMTDNKNHSPFKGWTQPGDTSYYNTGHHYQNYIAGFTSPSDQYVGNDILIRGNNQQWLQTEYRTFHDTDPYFVRHGVGAFIVSTTAQPWSPIPEPSTSLLLLSGLALLFRTRSGKYT